MRFQKINLKSLNMKRIYPLLLVNLFIWLILVIFLYRIFGPGLPMGHDSMSQLALLQYIGEYFQKYHHIPIWNPYWHAGTTVLQSYHPLFFYITLPLYLVFKNVFTVYKIYVLLIFLILGSSIFYIIYKQNNILSGLIGSLFFCLAPALTMYTFQGGMYPLILSIIFWVWSFYFTIKIVKSDSYIYVIVLGIILSLFILSHAGAASFGLQCLFIFLILYELFNKKMPFKSGFKFLISLLIGLCLSAWWLIPFFGRYFTTFNIPLSELLAITSLNWQNLLGLGINISKWEVTLGPSYLGLFVSLFALIAVIKKRSALNIALFLIGIYGSIFVLGLNTPIYKFLPLASRTEPIYMLFIPTFSFAYLFSTLFNETKDRNSLSKLLFSKNSILALAMLFISVLSFFPMLDDLAQNRNQPNDLINACKRVEGIDNDGRISYIYNAKEKLEERRLLRILDLGYYAIYICKREMVGGFWFNRFDLYLYYDELFLANNLQWLDLIKPLWQKKTSQRNIRFLLVNPSFLKDKKDNIFPEFNQIFSQGKWVLYFRNKKSSPVQIMDRNCLIIGENAKNLAVNLPWAAEGTKYLEDYEKEYLDLYQEIILASPFYLNKQKAEKIVQEFIAKGGRVIINLSQANEEFLGVKSAKIKIEKNSKIIKIYPNSLINDLDFNSIFLDSRYKNQDFTFYQGLDKNYLDINANRKNFPIYGEKRIGQGKIYFIGAPLEDYFFIADNKNLKTLVNRLLEIENAPKNIELPSLETKDFKKNEESLSFSYHIEKPLPALISTSYDPEWSAWIDDQEIKIYNHEGLILMMLPQGNHEFLLKFENYQIFGKIYSQIISILTLILITLLLINLFVKKRVV